MWTEARVDLLKTLCTTKASAAMICDQINAQTSATFTRNAIIGKALRLDLFKTKPKMLPREVQRKKPTPQPRFKEREQPTLSAPVASLNIPFMDRRLDQCPWPTEGAGWQMICCGLPVSRGSYCEGHAFVAYVRPQRFNGKERHASEQGRPGISAQG